MCHRTVYMRDDPRYSLRYRCVCPSRNAYVCAYRVAVRIIGTLIHDYPSKNSEKIHIGVDFQNMQK